MSDSRPIRGVKAEGGGGVEKLLTVTSRYRNRDELVCGLFSYCMKYSLPYFFSDTEFTSVLKCHCFYRTAANKQMNRAHVLVQSTTKENMCKRT